LYELNTRLEYRNRASVCANPPKKTCPIHV
jgi:hypothetical protein